MNVLGLDLSLTATGVAVILDSQRYWTEVIKRPNNQRDWDERRRLRWMAETTIGYFADENDPGWNLAVVEGLAFSRTTGHATARAGLWWLVTESLDLSGIPLAVMGPTSRAKYATGRGNASKADVMREVARRFPDFHGGEDEADALVCAAAGADHLGQPVTTMPATHRAALDAVPWPDERKTT